jgi:membrane fusion protein, multidrug efflux system
VIRNHRHNQQRVQGPGSIALAALGLSLLAPGAGARAQEPPASPVRYTEVREAPVRRTINLPGTVESRTSSLVATEVEGLVIDLRVREGDTIRKGAPMARLRTTSLELRLRASRAELKEAASRLKLAELNLDRVRGLFQSQIVSQQQLDDAQYGYTAQEGRVEQLAAQIDQIQHDIDRSTIVAPFGGTIVAKRTEVGEWLAVGAPVVEMISLAELEVRVEVPERYFRSMSPGAAARVTFESLPGLEVDGRVVSVIPRAGAQSRTFPVKVRIANREGRIGSGMLAQVALPSGESYRATIVPKDAVVSQGPQQVVFLINGDNTVTPVTVATGDGVGAWVTVEGQLRHGQKVVTRGNERLRPGQQVVGEPLEYALP